MNPWKQANYELWDGRAEPHFQSAFYDVDAFRAGASSLTPIEVDALGDVTGKSMLHLQCHFGQDTLSWARRGAAVTGVDFSERSIALARTLQREVESQLTAPARFLQSDVYELPRVLDETFDIVFTSYGVLKWLPDIDRWGEIVARYLKPGGTFFLVEFHPFLYVFDYEKAETIAHSYFYRPEPIAYDEVASYADPNLPTVQKAYAWSHGVSNVITALLRAGLRIDGFEEYPYSTIDCFPFVTAEAPGRCVHKTHPNMVPLLYSVRASKPA